MNKRILGVLGLTVGASAFAVSNVAAAQLSTSSAQTIAVNAANDLGAVLATVIPVILVIVVSLMAIGLNMMQTTHFL